MTDDVVAAPVNPAPDTTTEPAAARRRRRWPWLVGTVVAVAGLTVAAIAWLGGSGAATAAAPHFVDETASSGLTHAYQGGFEYYVGGGVATFDCDGNGLPDLYLAGGSGPAALYRNTSTVGGALHFEQVPSPVTDLTSVTGAYPLDVDSDGITDLVVLRNAAGNVVLRGLGGCRFEPANDRFGVPGGSSWSVAFSATWEGTNRLPTMAFGNYLVPGTYDCDTNQLVRPAATGDRYDAPVPLSPAYCTLSLLFSDWSRSGHADLRVANDRHYYRDGTEQLWQVAPGQAPRQYTAADGWRQLQIWGMGIASRDLDGDGYPEVFITSQGDDKLQQLDAPGTTPAYHDIALKSGVTSSRPFTGGDILPSTAWHPEFVDVDDDGNVDLFITKGNVDGQLDNAMRDPSDLLLGRSDGTFREATDAAGLVRYDKARGASVTDLNLDGLPDLVVVNRAVGVTVWRNVGAGDAARPKAMGHWLEVRLQQPAPNVDAVGAWLDVRVGGKVTTTELTVGGGHASGAIGWIHTGLGAATSADVRVHWPNGDVGPWATVQANQFVTITRGEPAPVVWHPPT